MPTRLPRAIARVLLLIAVAAGLAAMHTIGHANHQAIALPAQQHSTTLGAGHSSAVAPPQWSVPPTASAKIVDGVDHDSAPSHSSIMDGLHRAATTDSVTPSAPTGRAHHPSFPVERAGPDPIPLDLTAREAPEHDGHAVTALFMCFAVLLAGAVIGARWLRSVTTGADPDSPAWRPPPAHRRARPASAARRAVVLRI